LCGKKDQGNWDPGKARSMVLPLGGASEGDVLCTPRKGAGPFWVDLEVVFMKESLYLPL
jgi:hypothetical protein